MKGEKSCTVCNIEKQINNFYKRYSECKICNIRRGVKRYYDNKEKISIQKKTHYEKNRDKLLQKQNDYRNKKTQTSKNYTNLVLNYKLN